MSKWNEPVLISKRTTDLVYFGTGVFLCLMIVCGAPVLILWGKPVYRLASIAYEVIGLYFLFKTGKSFLKTLRSK